MFTLICSSSSFSNVRMIINRISSGSGLSVATCDQKTTVFFTDWYNLGRICLHIHTKRRERKGLTEVWTSNTDGMREKIRGKKMNQKLWVIVPAQCTQLSIVQVLRASAITAQLMPVAWLQSQLGITTLGPVQKRGEKKKGRRDGNWILAVSERRKRVRVEGCMKSMKAAECELRFAPWPSQSVVFIYLYLWLTPF